MVPIPMQKKHSNAQYTGLHAIGVGPDGSCGGAGGGQSGRAMAISFKSAEGGAMGHCRRILNMHDPAVFAICIQGEIGEDWAEYFGVRKISTERPEAGFSVTVLTTEPVDQAGLVGMINHVNMLGLPLVSVECLSAPDVNGS